ncbi:MAG: YgiQ family radical SAM protein [Endomicrobiales bacterium]
MFLPTTVKEIKALGWDRPDVILVTGDAYIDSPHVGVAVIGKYLMKHGFRTAVIAQPSSLDGRDITRLGEPKLFWGVSAGCIDSMVANYTPTKKWRKQDDYTPGGINARPDRTSIAYTNLIRRYFKPTQPVVLGGIEASLRRIAHYDYWDNAVRRSLLFDAKADILAFGMAEKTVLELAGALKEGADWKKIKGLCYISGGPAEGYLTLPSFEEARGDAQAFWKMFALFYENADNTQAGFVQKHGERFLVHNPPRPPVSTEELDEVYALDFERDAHPYYKTGEIRALETIRQSLTTHRGCYGRCNFCAITVHQGRAVTSRSAGSVLDEARRVAQIPGFNGIIYDVGGPTANMYGTSCRKGFSCKNRHCLVPQPCENLSFGHKAQSSLLQRLMAIPGMKKVYISSGIRHDMVVADREHGRQYVEELVHHHVSGQIKLAPEHNDNEVLSLMNKPSVKPLVEFKAMFDDACRNLGKNFFLTYYLMAAHPGCRLEHMQRLKDFLSAELKLLPEQVQVFTPTPSTVSTAMYHCGRDLAGNTLFCEKDLSAKQRQKDAIKKTEHAPAHSPRHSHRQHFPRKLRRYYP